MKAIYFQRNLLQFLKVQCPYCHSTSVKNFENNYYCNDCDHEFDKEDLIDG